MYGLEAISYANGWAMAAVGASIVVTGLSVLSFLISQLHHIIDLFENKDPDSALPKGSLTLYGEVKNTIPERLPVEVEEAAKVYVSFAMQLGDKFTLMDLYQLSNEVGLPHPHLSIRNFRDSGVLIPLGDGLFSWKSTVA